MMQHVHIVDQVHHVWQGAKKVATVIRVNRVANVDKVKKVARPNNTTIGNDGQASEGCV